MSTRWNHASILSMQSFIHLNMCTYIYISQIISLSGASYKRSTDQAERSSLRFSKDRNMELYLKHVISHWDPSNSKGRLQMLYYYGYANSFGHLRGCSCDTLLHELHWVHELVLGPIQGCLSSSKPFMSWNWITRGTGLSLFHRPILSNKAGRVCCEPCQLKNFNQWGLRREPSLLLPHLRNILIPEGPLFWPSRRVFKTWLCQLV